MRSMILLAILSLAIFAVAVTVKSGMVIHAAISAAPE